MMGIGHQRNSCDQVKGGVKDVRLPVYFTFAMLYFAMYILLISIHKIFKNTVFDAALL